MLASVGGKPVSQRSNTGFGQVAMALIDATREDSPEHWLAEADAALYQAKHNGRNQVVCRTQAG